MLKKAVMAVVLTAMAEKAEMAVWGAYASNVKYLRFLFKSAI